MQDTPVATKRTIRYSEFTPEVEATRDVYGALDALFQVVTAIGGKSTRLPALPLPEGAADRVKAALDDADFDLLISEIEAGYAAYRAQNDTTPVEGTESDPEEG